MSGWTVITVRGKTCDEYEGTVNEYEHDRVYATKDLAATFDEDERVGEWTSFGFDHVYALLNCGRYDFTFAEEIFEDYGHIIDDAVALGWDDTTDSGSARYYPRPDLGKWLHEYNEYDPHYGERACAVMYAQHGIYAQNPFHNPIGRFDQKNAEQGKSRVK